MKTLTTSPVEEDGCLVLLARIYTTAGAVAVPGNFSTLTLDVYDTEDLVNAIAASVSLSPVSDYIYGSLQTDRDWTINYDATGYNFAYVIPAAYLPNGGKVYRFQFVANAGGGYKQGWKFNVPTLDMAGR